MIHANPNPKMTVREVKEFRDTLHKCVSREFTPEEERKIALRKKRMGNVAKKIIANNGGKNPILGY
ncbi:hypothetical protein [Bacteroides sp.]